MQDGDTRIDSGTAAYSSDIPKPEIWYYIEAGAELRSGARNSYFGYATKLSQKLNCSLRLITDSEEIYRISKQEYKGLPVNISRASELIEKKPLIP